MQVAVGKETGPGAGQHKEGKGNGSNMNASWRRLGSGDRTRAGTAGEVDIARARSTTALHARDVCPHCSPVRFRAVALSLGTCQRTGSFRRVKPGASQARIIERPAGEMPALGPVAECRRTTEGELLMLDKATEIEAHEQVGRKAKPMSTAAPCNENWRSPLVRIALFLVQIQAGSLGRIGPQRLGPKPQRLGVSRKETLAGPPTDGGAGLVSNSLSSQECASVLVLSRKEGQQIVIDSKIVITILKIAGGVVRIGIEAPRNVAVHRKEVFEELAKQGRILLSDPATAPTAIADAA